MTARAAVTTYDLLDLTEQDMWLDTRYDAQGSVHVRVGTLDGFDERFVVSLSPVMARRLAIELLECAQREDALRESGGGPLDTTPKGVTR